MKKFSFIIILILVSMLALGAIGFHRFLENSSPSDSIPSRSELYLHQFDLVIDTEVSGLIEDFCLEFNVISANSAPYETIDDFYGDGFIISASGLAVHYYYQLFFDSRFLNSGTIAGYVVDFDDSASVQPFLFTDVHGIEVTDNVICF